VQWRNFATADADVATNHAPVTDQLIHDFGCQLKRNSKADPFRGFAIVALIK
jgi:hypothetical protein